MTQIPVSPHAKAEAISFWNGNKSAARQNFETELLQTLLNQTAAEYGPSVMTVDNTNYPKAEDEATVFENGTDILVTVAGNSKFANKAKIEITVPLTKGLLGFRLLIINAANTSKFNRIETEVSLQKLSIGIPETWVDADLFRSNNYNVTEKGTFNELFDLLLSEEFDYTSLGANEIEQALIGQADKIMIEPSILLYYPFPLIFLVNADQPELAERVNIGLQSIMNNGLYDAIFDNHYGSIVTRLNLRDRKLITLNNPSLPESMKNFRSTLLD